MLTDTLHEIYVSMSRNKLRIALTGFAIAWGIFMLIVLLGAGNGLLHGMMSNFGSQAQNVVRLWPGRTSLPYEGRAKGRRINFDVEQLDFLVRKFPDIVETTIPVISASGTMTRGSEYVSVRLTGGYPGRMFLGRDVRLVAGRHINDIDAAERRKVLLIGENTVAVLFPRMTAAQAVGQWVNVSGIPFQVVGVYHERGGRSSHEAYAALPTIATIFKPDGHLSQVGLLVVGLDTEGANLEFEERLRSALAQFYGYDREDYEAVWIWNQFRNYVQTQNIFAAIRSFIWIIGLATLIAGIAGISNIMMITVRERTREFGIRKALGAPPRSILALVLLESVGITMLFGYIGMLCGIGLTQLVASLLGPASEEGFTMFLNPTVDLGIVLAANVVMILAGVIAGYIPARRAVSIRPVEALAAV